jgi:hypothetical protein
MKYFSDLSHEIETHNSLHRASFHVSVYFSEEIIVNGS